MRFSLALRNFKQRANGWFYMSLVGAAVVLLPLFTIIGSLFKPSNENWQHIKQYLLFDYLLQSVWLVLLSSFFTIVLGVGLAWLLSAYDFPLRRFFRIALILPLAIPPYIGAYTYSNMMSYTGFVQIWIRNEWNVTPNAFWFDVMSMRGAVTIFTLFLFPYVYLLSRAFLERQSGSYIENARLLGRGPLSVFFRIVLPIARPAIIGGVILVVFEVLSDYGVTSYFGIQSFSVAIFQTWFGMYDMDSAVRLAALLMAGVVILLVIERLFRHRRSFAVAGGKSKPLVARKLRGAAAALALSVCTLVFAAAFLIPVIQLSVWASWTYDEIFSSAFIELTSNTVTVALLAACIIMVVSVIVANVCRTSSNVWTYVLSKSVTSGYSIPGAIIAIGVLVLFVGLDHLLAPVYPLLGMGSQGPLVLSMSLIMLIVAYVVRFMASGYNAVDSGYDKIGNKYTEASRLLGFGMTRTFFKVEAPLLRGALLSGFILTFVEIVKELPLTLLLRPFNFETLATKAYQYASDEKIHEASIPSLFIIAVSLISVFLFHKLGKKMES